MSFLLAMKVFAGLTGMVHSGHAAPTAYHCSDVFNTMHILKPAAFSLAHITRLFAIIWKGSSRGEYKIQKPMKFPRTVVVTQGQIWDVVYT